MTRIVATVAAVILSVATFAAEPRFDGVLALAENQGRDFAVSAVENGCFAVDFEARVPQTPAVSGHFSACFTGERGVATVYSSGKGIFHIVRDHGKEQPRVDILTATVDFRGSAWHKMHFAVGTDRIQLTADGELVFTKTVDLGPLKTVRLQNYRMPFEARGLTTEPMAGEREDFLDAPVWAGDWKLKASRDFDVAKQLRNRAGALMFWFTMPSDNFSMYGRPLFRFKDAQGRDQLSGDLDFSGFSCTFGVPGAQARTYKLHNLAENWKHAGTRCHFAVTWNGPDVRLYFNGVPYSPYEGYYNPPREPLYEKGIESAVSMTLFGGEYDGLKLFRRPIANQDVWKEFRAEMPIDIALREQMVESDRPFTPVVTLAPGGDLLAPSPVDERTSAHRLVLVTSLYRPGQKAEPLLRESRTLDIDKRVDIALREMTLPAGRYVFEAKVVAAGSRRPCAYVVDFLAAPYPKAQASSDDDYRRGDLLFERKLNDPSDKSILRNRKLLRRRLDDVAYLETGSDRHERFSFEIRFPKRVQGHPVLLELDWPDTATRMMGVYLYVPSKGYCDRDRLQQGIQSGREYPLSGKMQTERFIFWPGTDDYLFELRTLYAGMPAAAAALRAYEIVGELPALRIREPEGLPGRRFGFFDEDQTWYTNLNQDWYNRVARTNVLSRDTFYMNELVRYYAYTGMNSFHSAILRYSALLYAGPSKTEWMPPWKTGGWRWFARALAANDIALTPIVNLWGLPELRTAEITGRTERYRDWCRGTKDGSLPPGGRHHGASFNFASNDEALAAYVNYVVEAARELKDEPNVSAMEFSYQPWGGLEVGYDEHAVSRFERETGITVPRDTRYDFLTSPAMKPRWIDWRCRRTTEAIRNIRSALAAVQPRWTLLWTVWDWGYLDGYPRAFYPEDPFWERTCTDAWRERLGVDIDAINAIPGVAAFRQNRENQCRWELHMMNRDTAIEDLQTDYRAVAKAFRKNGRAAPYAEIYATYYENMEMKQTLMPEKYSSFFQDADVKGNGRYWLKTLVFSVATQDALETTIGAQPFGTIGREALAREFARAYRALPARSFSDVPGAEDPVTVRYLETEAGTYFYLANVSHAALDVRLKWQTALFSPAPTAAENLSTGREEPIGVIAMKPYELRSFLLRGRKRSIVSVASTLDGRTHDYLNHTAAAVREALARVKAVTGEDLPVESAAVAAMDEALKGGHAAEAHRLQQSLCLRRLVAKAAKSLEVAEQKRETERGHIAVNCGCDDYFRGTDGKLFYPDAPWKDQQPYGYLGASSLTALRDVATLKETPYKGLYQSERYDVDGYRFSVPNGTYTVKLYMRWGYRPEFEPGKLTVSATANGKEIIRDFDYYRASDGDMDKPLVITASDIPVANGRLDVRLQRGTGSRSSTVRALLGIETERQK